MGLFMWRLLVPSRHRVSWDLGYRFGGFVNDFPLNSTYSEALPGGTRCFSMMPEEVRNQRGEYFTVTKTNKNFEEFYQSQNTCQDWDQCLDYMRRCLLQSIRVNRNRPQSARVIQNVLQDFASSTENRVDEVQLRQMEWDPYVWQFSSTRWDLHLHPEINPFLHHQFSNGNIYRQELVSMMPVHFLNIQPHHKVLDICAAPGSKTKQALESLHARNTSAEFIPPGFVIANEFDPGRCLKLACNVNSYASPCVMLMNHEGSRFPDIPDVDQDGNLIPMKFDRIICDVPCSGDGTIRKNQNIWTAWTPGAGNHRHQIQYRILRRSVELLEKDGLIAYSSCAINPIENEAVLQRILSESQGALEILKCPPQPGINYLQGHTNWRVFDSEMTEYTNWSEVPKRFTSQVLPEMFPSGLFNEQLRRSMRFLPHLMNDGGFFVAILKKKSNHMPWERSECHFKMPEKSLETKFRALSGIARWDKSHGRLFKKMWIPLKTSLSDREAVAKALEFYFPSGFLQSDHLHSVKNDLTSKLWLANPRLLAIKERFHKTSPQGYNMFKLGLLAFVKDKKTHVTSCPFKPSKGPAGNLLLPHIKRAVRLSSEDFKIVLENPNPNVEFRKHLSAEGIAALSELSPPGNCKLSVHFKGESDIVLECLAFVGHNIVEIQVTTHERYHYRLTLNPSDVFPQISDSKKGKSEAHDMHPST
ncbi:RNA cytosine-C(5)-methyltransferase NSUN2-like isoform X1 [Tigriopus californicus]|uniref:RNA cytosine-C(5)-methyltransferase NSUN2-like isoform X1 n=2 Tax=Tigriopus californicus TaxID=6832 RepID=UPI0027DA06A1|nr:RNA cytosine-C(5)-methyltransferase NSUN2-like isoform X1 [Tigriopus californicus]